MNASAATKRVNEVTPDPSVVFDLDVAKTFVRYARMVVARGYIYNTLGNMAIRVPHSAYPDGVLYTKPSGISLEEVEPEQLVITDIPDGRLLHGATPTSVGHQLNREILRLRPDAGAVIHVHDNHIIAWLAASEVKDIRPVSLEFPYVLAKPPYVVPSSLDVEDDVSPIKDFIANTNSLVMVRHGVTTLGRNISEAYHRLNSFASEIRRIVLVETLSAAKGTKPEYLTAAEAQWMYERAEGVIYPKSEAVA
jgi:ribulose-5-phosphate 4-epimerase/fuculose-1-phosphate aldolase